MPPAVVPLPLAPPTGSLITRKADAADGAYSARRTSDFRETARLRIDKVLWFLRFAGSRSWAQEWVAAGHIRINGRRIERSSADVRIGDVLVLPLRHQVRVIEILALPLRRGPAGEAQACYRVLDDALDDPGGTPLARDQREPEG